MSAIVFPALAGLSWNVVKTPEFSTQVQTSVSGLENRASFWTLPRWHFTLVYDLLRNTSAKKELGALMGLFLQMRGQGDTFLYEDPNDHAVVGQAIGTANGSQAAFQLLRTVGDGNTIVFDEPIKNIHAISEIRVGGSANTNYGLGSTGIITFNPIPGGGAIVGDYSYYFRCRFKQDLCDFEEFMHNLYQAKKVELISVK